METLFTKISREDIPSVKLYEDETCFVILDINPVKKGHALVIAREPFKNIGETPDDVLSHMISVAKVVEGKMRQILKCNGSNILINNDPASGQEVPHIHIHVIPRFDNDNRKLSFEHDKYEDGEIQEFGEKLKI